MDFKAGKKQGKSIITDLFTFAFSFISYLFLRLKIIVFYSWAFFIWVVDLVDILKDELVKRMFWGRRTFYRSAFQFSVGLMTFIIGISGLAGRLNLFAPQAPAVLAFPAEQLGDADYLDESASIQAIVATDVLVREFDVQAYIVQRGDTLVSIAEKFEVSTDTIRWANGIVGDYLKVGQELEILPINGVIHPIKKGDSLESIATKYQASVQDIYDINWLDSKILKEGQELLVPNGRMPQPKPIVKPSAPITSAPPSIPPGGAVGTGSFIRPIGCGKITGWYSAWHRGVDIAGSCQTVAVDSGVVTMARWYGAGGLQVMVNHGNGFVSLYAHHSSLYVREGQKVARGQPLGHTGCTGRCTGVHLHFGLSRNGIWVNPLGYIRI